MSWASAQTTQEGGGVLPQRDDDQIAKPPMCVQATQLLIDIRSNSLIARGNVEIYYNNFTLTADQVIDDRNANKLIAEVTHSSKTRMAASQRPTASRPLTISAKPSATRR
jgi:lipopolysaccharide export system protein LptA